MSTETNTAANTSTNTFTNTSKTLALFDFDGTITRKDSLVGFIQHAVGKPRYYAGLIKLSPMLSAFLLKKIPNDQAKTRFISHYFKGWNSDNFEQCANQYSLEQLDKIVRPGAITKIKWHQAQGHQVMVVSASMVSWLRGWCERHQLGLIATEMQVSDGKLTGQFATPNCHGAEKVKRVSEVCDLDRYDTIYAYGDSSGDSEMLALADERFYQPFR
ncbi:MAG: phosphatidylglycerophosphatase C [Phenylobacterium sp.]|jgi:phosphatidylglycerophosphatase C